MDTNNQRDLHVLQEQLQRLETQMRRQRCVTLSGGIGMLVLVACGFLAQPPQGFRNGSARINAVTVDSLTVRQLVVLDAHGTPRAMLGAPLPEPLMMGKRFRRRGSVSGLMLYDSEGNERGGYVTGDSGRGAALTLDEINRAAVHLGVNERGEMHLTMSNGQGHWSGLGITPRGSYLQLGTAGKVIFDATDSTRRVR